MAEMNIYVKHDVEYHEYKTHLMVYNSFIVRCPRIIAYDKRQKIMVMEKIPGQDLSRKYGEKYNDVPPHLTEQVREIVQKLYDYCFSYRDITGYNFIECNDEVWVIDFEHACYNENYDEYDEFIDDFLNGEEDWNPNFK